MWWPDTGAKLGRAARVAAALAAAGILAGCFQPLYSDRTPVGGQGMRQLLSSVDVAQIGAPNGTPLARLAVEVRNAILFDLTGGAGSSSPTHQLNVRLSTSRQSVIVDITTARPDIENYSIDATYTLVDLSTGKTVMKGTTFARVSADIPGQEQRFARLRGGRDAENRAAKVIAENIRSRLASYFVAGT
jgi:LPS-assembly lipoprotein